MFPDGRGLFDLRVGGEPIAVGDLTDDEAALAEMVMVYGGSSFTRLMFMLHPWYHHCDFLVLGRSSDAAFRYAFPSNIERSVPRLVQFVNR